MPPTEKPSPKVGVNHQIYKPKTTAHYPMVMDTVAARFMAG